MFMKDWADDRYMRLDFITFYDTCNKINKYLKVVKIVRDARVETLSSYFDKERKTMMNYYIEKSKKKSKFKSLYL